MKHNMSVKNISARISAQKNYFAGGGMHYVTHACDAVRFVIAAAVVAFAKKCWHG